MDPNEVLKKARDASSNLMTRLPFEKDYNPTDEAASELVNAFEVLDDWLSKGGFLPDGWKAAGRAR